MFNAYGIDRLEGAGISSITVTKPGSKTKDVLEIQNEDALIDAGFYKKILDTAAVQEALESDKDSIGYMTAKEYSSLSAEEITTPSKLKVNKRRGVNNTTNLDMEVAS